MSNTCTGEHYSCGDKHNWQVASETVNSITQTRNNKSSFYLGETEIIVLEQIRNFTIQGETRWDLKGSDENAPFLMIDDEGDYFACAVTENNAINSVSELYKIKTTQCHFIDTRYNNGAFTETYDTVTFYKSGSSLAGFKEKWGVNYYHKFVIDNHAQKRTITKFVVLNGIKTILDTVTTYTNTYTPTNPLILVYPNPPSLAIPWVNCEDINIYGFYDYHAGGPPPDGSKRIREDGGDDFYWPEWCRAIGDLNAAADAAAAEERYQTFYLNQIPAPIQSISNPGIFIDTTPCCSIARDKSGNVFYSINIDGVVYNSLTNGDPVTLSGITGDNPKFYPVGVA